MAVVEVTKRFECAFFTPNRKKCSDWVEAQERRSGVTYEIIPILDGMTFKGFAALDENQIEYYSKFFALDSPVIGFFDKAAAWECTPNNGVSLWG